MNFEDFKILATDSSLSQEEKIGFGKGVREGQELLILNDIIDKLYIHKKYSLSILDIGSGCGDLVSNIINLCKNNNHELTLIDSKEMLDNIESTYPIKLYGKFPFPILKQYDRILIYSVIQYIDNPFLFIEESCKLLKPGGKLLIGDIPNYSKAKRYFLNTQKGKEELLNRNIVLSPFNKIDDSIVLSILNKFRQQDYNVYVLPQNSFINYSNKREDILIEKL